MKLELRGLTKAFEPDRPVIQPTDFADDVHALAVIGPSGGGKSTLLRLIGGLLLPDAGEVWLDGERLGTSENELLAYRRRLGFVFQQSGLFKHLSAYDNINLPLLKVHGYDAAGAAARTAELLERFGLTADAHKKPSALSGGQQQRVAIARAVAARPKLLLFDEPTSALDPEYTTEVLDIIDELKHDGMDFIIVTHEMGFARHACDRVLFLCDGALREYGESDRIFAEPQTPELQRFFSKLLEWNV